MTFYEEARAWHDRAEELADWTMSRVVVRNDVWGSYLDNGKTTTRPWGDERGKVFLDRDTIIRHYRATKREDVIGYHLGSPAPDSMATRVAGDIDKHSDADDARANSTAAIHWFNKAEAEGFKPLLLDSNGGGGYHLNILFNALIPLKLAYQTGNWLFSDQGGRLPTIEVFPKQAELALPGNDGDKGNWLRGPGPHHKLQHWSKVWNGCHWLQGDAAIDYILALEGDDPALIPAAAFDWTDSKTNPPPPQPKRYNASNYSNVMKRAAGYLKKCEPAISGQRGHDKLMWSARCMVRGFDLSPDVAFDLLVGEYNPRCTPAWSEKEIWHKCRQAEAVPFHKPKGWLLGDASPPWTSNGSSNGHAGHEQKEEPKGDAYEGPEAEQTPPPPPRRKNYNPKLYTSAEFFATKFKREYYINGALVKNQPGAVGGGKKMLKSSAGIDAAVSLDTATPFLGHFVVPKRVNVLVLNGESGESTLQETAARIAHARGINESELQIIWGTELPRLANDAHLSDLADIFTEYQIGVGMIDPSYLCLLAGNANGAKPSDLFEMGAVYSRFARACLSVGTTPLLYAHCKKDRTNGPPDLDDLAFAGVAEFVRQWILISRRDPYAGDGVHKLWLSIGGSAGHSFLGHLDVEEGVAGDNFEGRFWSTTVTPFGEVAKVAKESRDGKKAEERTADESSVLNLIDQIVRLGEPATLTRIRNGSGLSRQRTDSALERLRIRCLIEPYKVEIECGNKAKMKVDAFRRLVNGS